MSWWLAGLAAPGLLVGRSGYPLCDALRAAGSDVAMRRVGRCECSHRVRSTVPRREPALQVLRHGSVRIGRWRLLDLPDVAHRLGLERRHCGANPRRHRLWDLCLRLPLRYFAQDWRESSRRREPHGAATHLACHVSPDCGPGMWPVALLRRCRPPSVNCGHVSRTGCARRFALPPVVHSHLLSRHLVARAAGGCSERSDRLLIRAISRSSCLVLPGHRLASLLHGRPSVPG